MSTEIGWADALGQQLAGDGNGWQRLRARGGRPFRACADDVVEKAKRGGKNGGGNTRYEKRKLDAALGKADEVE
jgi:hypothetical protein